MAKEDKGKKDKQQVKFTVDEVMRCLWMHVSESDDLWFPDVADALKERLQQDEDEFWDSLPAPEEWDELEVDVPAPVEPEGDYVEWGPNGEEEWHTADNPNAHNKGEWHVDPDEVRKPNRRDNG